MFGNIGGSELFLILLIVLVFFGARKLPELARGLGEGIKEFRKASREIQSEVEKEPSGGDKPPSPEKKP